MFEKPAFEGPRASLDLTHVLCESYRFVVLGQFIHETNRKADDDSSVFSFLLAVITLTPILLMVSNSKP